MTVERFDCVNDICQRLSGDARMRYVDQGMAAPTTAEDLKRARAFVNGAVERGDITAAALARRANVKESAISAFRNAK
jgi:hypothetical protein